ncbi:hypothetical protein Y032_0409g937 [Ancylostoma ceylanicum]|uniref:Secreted protein n=1 Tax=Ancylostoma ceylanicum TaxID=53326 RepID=A0A016X4C6_9BILA|nr:hypothetical protein Y032_0409g937 [Ancylostoma ceylanicum]
MSKHCWPKECLLCLLLQGDWCCTGVVVQRLPIRHSRRSGRRRSRVEAVLHTSFSLDFSCNGVRVSWKKI